MNTTNRLLLVVAIFVTTIATGCGGTKKTTVTTTTTTTSTTTTAASTSGAAIPGANPEKIISFIWGFIDKTGHMIIKPQYEDVRQFSEGLAGVKKDGLW